MLLITFFVCGILTSLLVYLLCDIVNIGILLLIFLGGTLTAALIFCIIVITYSQIKFSYDKPLKKPDKFLYHMTILVSQLVLTVSRVHVYVRGLDKLPQDKKFCVYINHQSDYDAIVFFWAMRNWCIPFIMKNSLLNVLFIGKILYGAGCLPLNRNNDREGIKTILKGIKYIKDDIASVVICPEGTRSKSYEMVDFKPGAFKVAEKAQAPLAIIAIQNTCRISKRWPLKSTKVYFDVVDVLEYEQYKDVDTVDLSNLVKEKLQTSLDELPKYEKKSQ